MSTKVRGSTYDMYSDIVDGDSDQVVSTSWGECELDSDASLLSSEQALLKNRLPPKARPSWQPPETTVPQTASTATRSRKTS